MPNNKMKRSVKSSNPFKDSVNLPGDSGLFGATPAPGFRDYPQSSGRTLPPTKFADTDFGEGLVKENPLLRNVKQPNIAEEMGLQTPGTTKIVKGRNRYERIVKKNAIGKDKV